MFPGVIIQILTASSSGLQRLDYTGPGPGQLRQDEIKQNIKSYLSLDFSQLIISPLSPVIIFTTDLSPAIKTTVHPEF